MDKEKFNKQEINSENESHQEAIVKKAGRGTIFITLAKLYFIVSGYGIYFVLPRVLSAKDFGDYGVVTGIVSIINAVIVIGTQQAVSKFVSEDIRRAEAVRRTALKLQCFVGGGITLGYFFAAPLIAKGVNDTGLVRSLQLAALIPLAYTFYSVYIGYLNGQKEFLRQSILDMTYSTLKVSLIVLLAILSHNVNGAILGFGLAAIAVLLLSPFITGRARDQIDISPSFSDFIKFQVALLGFTLVNNLLQKTDLILLKALGSSSSQEASELAGYYTALMALANTTYQAIISVTFVLFPLISTATVEARAEEIKSYIRETLKYTLMIMMLSATMLSSNSAQILRFLYRETYVVGASALAIAAYGIVCFGLIYILTTIISSSGNPRISLVIGLLVLVSSLIFNTILIPQYRLVGAATGTSLAMLMGATIAGLYVLKRFGALIEAKTLIVIMVAALMAYLIAKTVPYDLIFKDRIVNLAMRLISQLPIYLGVLILFREIGMREINLMRKIISI